MRTTLTAAIAAVSLLAVACGGSDIPADTTETVETVSEQTTTIPVTTPTTVSVASPAADDGWSAGEKDQVISGLRSFEYHEPVTFLVDARDIVDECERFLLWVDDEVGYPTAFPWTVQDMVDTGDYLRNGSERWTEHADIACTTFIHRDGRTLVAGVQLYPDGKLTVGWDEPGSGVESVTTTTTDPVSLKWHSDNGTKRPSGLTRTIYNADYVGPWVKKGVYSKGYDACIALFGYIDALGFPSGLSGHVGNMAYDPTGAVLSWASDDVNAGYVPPGWQPDGSLFCGLAGDDEFVVLAQFRDLDSVSIFHYTLPAA